MSLSQFRFIPVSASPKGQMEKVAAAPAAASAADKVKVHMRPLGAAPPLAKPKIRANRSDLFAVLINHARSQLAAAAAAEGLPILPDQAVHCFLCNSFSPSPTQRLDDLFECFGTGDELVILYSLTPSFG